MRPLHDSDKLCFSLKDLYAQLQSVESKQCFFCIFLSGNGKQQALQLGRMLEGPKDA